ncbi:MAG: D-arabinono-1,4-lactone oxidase [Brachybacterium sp.]|nr:D-arabinono-1,4-lactone oxidase [Brachybacterium sp.]
MTCAAYAPPRSPLAPSASSSRWSCKPSRPTTCARRSPTRPQRSYWGRGRRIRSTRGTSPSCGARPRSPRACTSCPLPRAWAEPAEEPSGIREEEGARHDRAYRIYPGGFMIPFHELEYYVGVDRAKDAWTALKDLILEDHPDQKYPIETRWTRGDDAHLSPFHREDKVSLSVSGAPGTDYWPYLRDVDELLQGYDATVHWGKLHLLDRERLDRLFPEAETFRSVRRELDPEGVFLNDHTRALLS